MRRSCRSCWSAIPTIPPQDARDGGKFIGVSAAVQEVRWRIARAAGAPFTVLIEGDSGSGKELVARAIHRDGCRRERALHTLNCAALTEKLVDAELFGHAKGAFTGAVPERLGLFESTDGGTVFLDEVGELSARAQAKLLRTLKEGEIRRIGENFTRAIDICLIAAGRFRQDLLYRLDVIRIAVPPLGIGLKTFRSLPRASGARPLSGLAAKPCSDKARFRRWRGMIGPATSESFRTCSSGWW